MFGPKVEPKVAHMALKPLKPTLEQEAIIAAAQTGKHLVIQAGAGTGKTATLRMVADVIGDRRAIYLAFNKAIAKEAAASFPSHVRCRTAHAVAMAAVGRAYQHRLNGPRQPARRAAELLGTGWFELGRDMRVSPVQMARIAVDTVRHFCHSAVDDLEYRHVPVQNGIVGADHRALAQVVLPYAKRAWNDLCDKEGTLRFEHDHYLKIWALSKPVIDADVIMLDEGQDSNAVVAQTIQAQSQAQQIIVGDSNQSLYEWRGAIDALQQWDADIQLYLSHSWRFGPEVAAEANKWLTQIGTQLRLVGSPAINSRLGPLDHPSAVLCRTNSEAMRQVMAMLEDGHKVALAGGGNAIRGLAEAAHDLKNGRRTNHPELYVFTSWAALQDYVDNESAGRDLKPFVDLIDSHGTEAIMNAVDSLVDEKRATTVVSTAHKSKGRQWSAVKIADDFAEPHNGEIPRADAMIAYVAVTRAQERLDRGGLAWIDHYPCPDRRAQPGRAVA